MDFISSKFERAVLSQLAAISHKLDIDLARDFRELTQGEAIMAKLSDLAASISAMTAKVNAESDTTKSVAILVTGLKDQVSKLSSQLDAAISGENVQGVQDVADGLKALNDAIDAQALANAAIVGDGTDPASQSGDSSSGSQSGSGSAGAGSTDQSGAAGSSGSQSGDQSGAQASGTSGDQSGAGSGSSSTRTGSDSDLDV